MSFDVIYQPQGQAGEYAPWASNHYENCGHGCVYCYVPKVRHVSRKEFDGEAVARKDYLARLDRDIERASVIGFHEQVMLSFLTDPYNPQDERLGLTRIVLRKLRDADIPFCILTKGGSKALRDIDLFRHECDAFASTLTHLDEGVSQKWEPYAAPPVNRLAALKAFHDAGVFTWVSLEPVYDTDMTLKIIDTAAPFVDLFKLGRINYHCLTKVIDWREFTDRAIALFACLGKRHYIKKDLQEYLPDGYPNPLRVPQNHSGCETAPVRQGELSLA